LIDMPTFLLEVGTEELPADFVDSAIAQWKERIPQSLKEQCLTHEPIEFYGTPRRLGVLIPGLLEQQPDREEEVKGHLPKPHLRMAIPPQPPLALPASRG
jgi:glycyl-tRNA synthetase beta chain